MREDEGDRIAPRGELDRLFQEIRRDATAGVRKYYALSGARMTGKTTLVWSLGRRLAAENVPLVYLDLETQRGMDLDGFYRHVSREMVEQWPVRVDAKAFEELLGGTRVDQNGFMRFLRWLSESTPDRRRVVVAIDDVGAVDRTDVASPFFATFRGLLNDHANRYWRYLFLFIGSLDLYELPNGALSPLLNACVDIRLGNLDREGVARTLGPVPGGDDRIADELFRLADGHPYLTQRLGQLLEARLASNLPLDPDALIEDVVDGRGTADPYIGHVLRQLERSESLRTWVKDLLDAEQPIPFSGPHDPAMYRPVLLGIAARGPTGHCRLANPVVARAIRRYFDASGADRIGRFPIKGKIYQGPRTKVYKAWHPDLDIPLAIKTLPSEWFESESDIRRFQLEAKVMLEFRHPNICPVYDFGRHLREYYIVMRYIQGSTFEKYLTGETTEILDQGPVGAALFRPLRMLLQIADAVQYAHERGVVHRDLKPSNVMIDLSHDGAIPVVIDFGLARNLLGPESSTITKEDLLLGTPAYLSPELAAGDQQKVGVASDVYQLGGILYQILTGAPPHASANLAALVFKVLHGESPRASRFDENVPPALDEVCARAMSRNPEDRYPDVSTFQDALAGAIGCLEAEGVYE